MSFASEFCISTAILAEPTSVKPEITPSSAPDSSVTSQSVTSQVVMETKVEESAGEVVDKEDVKEEAEEDLEAGEENGEGDEAGKIDLKYWSSAVGCRYGHGLQAFVCVALFYLHAWRGKRYFFIRKILLTHVNFC